MRCLAALSVLALSACATVDSTPSSVGPTLFVANKFGDTLSAVDLTTGRETARVPTCENPHELATSPDDRHVALACYGGTTVEIYRTADLGLAKRVELGANARPHGIVWHSNGSIYATAEGRRSIVRIDDPLGRATTAEFATGKDGSHMLAVAPDGRTAWTTDLGSKTVTRIDLTGPAAPRSMEVGLEPEGIALEPNGETLWVSARRSDKAFALDPDTLTVRAEIDTGPFPLRLAIRPQGGVAVTSDLAAGSLTVLDLETARAIRAIPVSSPAEAEARQQVTILWSDDGSRIYVAETGTDTIAEVDYATGAVVRRMAVGDGGDGLAIAP